MGCGGAAGAVARLEVVCPSNVHMSTSAAAATHPTARFAAEHGIPVRYCPARGPWDDWDVPDGFDVGAVVSFGRLIPAAVLSALPQGAINLHPSLLPRHRGAAPLQWALLQGDARTGISVVDVLPHRFDAGRILLQEAVDVAFGTTLGVLRQQLGALGACRLVTALAALDTFRAQSVPQDAIDGVQPSWARCVTRADGRIHWDRHSVQDIYRRFFALGKEFGVQAVYGGEAVRLIALQRHDKGTPYTVQARTDVAPGGIVYEAGAKVLYVRCADGWLGCRSLQLPCESPISAKVFATVRGLAEKSASFDSWDSIGTA